VAVSDIQLHSFQIPTVMSQTKFLNTLLQEVMRSSKNEPLFISDLSDLTLQIISDAWWASMNVCVKHSIACNTWRHAPKWRVYLHCGIEETGWPGIIFIDCHQVLCDPSDLGTSSMGKHLLVTGLVLAKVPGYPAAAWVGMNPEAPVRVRNCQATQSGWTVQGCYPAETETRSFSTGLEPDFSSNFTFPIPLVAIKYWSSDCIMIWSVHRLCCSARSFTSRFQMYDLTEQTSKSTYYNTMRTKEIHSWHLGLIYINWNDRQHPPNR